MHKHKPGKVKVIYLILFQFYPQTQEDVLFKPTDVLLNE